MARDRHNPLGAAHRGYVYQDAATALALLWALYQGADEVVVDRKAHAGDLFDDLTIRAGGRILRRQFKSTADESAIFVEEHLKTTTRDLRIDDLVSSVRSDWPVPVDEYRVCATWMSPTDPVVLAFLEPSDAPGSFDRWPTRRWKLQPDVLWPSQGNFVWDLRGPSPMTRDEFVAFTGKLVIELECPQVSLDLEEPGPLETLLFEYLTNRIGVGRYPNEGRLVQDVAERLIRRASQARAAQETIVPERILGAIGLRTDFGRVAQQFPVVDTEEIRREDVLATLEERSLHDSFTIVIGSPGSGKSWLLTELCDVLKTREALVARHYCYLQPGDNERELRITSDALYANLMAELADSAPELRGELTTRFAAGPGELAEMLSAARRSQPERRIVLVVDGLDHIARVAREAAVIQPYRFSIIEELVGFPWPEGVALVLGSQPGYHLEPLSQGHEPVVVPPWASGDLRMLAERAGVFDLLRGSGFEETVQNEVTELLVEKAEGNPLYASFLIRQMTEAGRSGELTDPASLLRDVPRLEGDLSNYYRYLVGPNGPDAVAEVLAHLDFSVSVADLQAVFPVLRTQVEPSIRRLRPVLTNVSAQGGVRVYHESFRRYVVEDRLDGGGRWADMLEPIIGWLERLGFFDDPRSYRFLFDYLRRAGGDQQVLSLVGPSFLTRSLIGGHPEAAVRHNLAIAADIATSQRNWPAVVRLAEVYYAAEICFDQKLTDPQLYGRAFAALYGADRLVAGLLFDGLPTRERGQGIVLCMHAEHLGSTPPWREYLQLPHATHWEEAQHTEVRADYRGRLAIDREGTLARTVSWLAQADDRSSWYAKIIAQEIRRAAGLQVLADLLASHQESAPVLRTEFSLELALSHAEAGDRAEAFRYGQMAVAIDRDIRTLWRLALGGVRDSSIFCPLPNIQEVTQAIAPGRYTNAEGVDPWIACIGLLAWTSPAELAGVRELVTGDGWYAGWLVFVIDLSLAEARSAIDRRGAEADLLAALDRLTNYDDPFSGEPRACDLYSIHPTLMESWERSLALIQTPSGWETAIGHLETISRHVTTSLHGAKSGPLSPDDLTDLLLSHLGDPDAQQSVLRVIQEQALAVENGEEYYESEALFQFRSVVALMSVGDKPAAEERWQRACQCLGGYGFRKDTTIYELIGSLRVFCVIDPEFLTQALDRLQPLIWELDDRTDGRETNRAIISWYKLLCEADAVSAALVLARQLAARGGTVYWRLEECLNKLLECSHEAIDPSLIVALLQTQPRRTETDYLKVYLGAIEQLQNSERQGEAFSRLCAQVIDEAGGDGNASAIVVLSQFADDHGLPFPRHTSKSDPETSSSESLPAPHPEVAGDAVDQHHPFNIPDGARPIDVIAAFSAIRAGKPHAVSTDDLLRELVPWMTIQLAGGSVEGVRGVVTALCSDFLLYGRKGLVIASLASAAESGGHVSYAAELYALAHVYTQEELEWHSKERNDAFLELTRAVELDESVAWQSAAAGLAQFLRRGCFPVCRARHLVPLSLRFGEIKQAKAVWEEAFAVVFHRLPSPGNRPGYGIPHYTPGAGDGWQLEEAFGRLLLARIDHPDTAIKRAALAGFATVLGAQSVFMVRGLREVFREQTPLTSLLFILQALWAAEPSPYLVTSRLRADILGCAKSELPALSRAAERLLDRLGGVT